MASRKRASDAAGASEGVDSKTKKTKVVNDGETSTAKTDANGDRYWEISKMRRVTVSEFRGKTMVSVREYYEKDGQELPGKKVWGFLFFFLVLFFHLLLFCSLVIGLSSWTCS